MAHDDLLRLQEDELFSEITFPLRARTTDSIDGKTIYLEVFYRTPPSRIFGSDLQDTIFTIRIKEIQPPLTLAIKIGLLGAMVFKKEGDTFIQIPHDKETDYSYLIEKIAGFANKLHWSSF